MIRSFGAIGDIHAEDGALASALDQLRQRGVDATLSVGDIVDGEGDLARCVELLRAHGVVTVRGNHERWFLEDKLRELPHAHRRADYAPELVAWLDALPQTVVLPTVMGPLLLCHAVGDDDMIKLLPEDDAAALANNDPLRRVLASGAQVMVCGHTHKRMARTMLGLTVINAGTLAPKHGPGYVHVDLQARVATFFAVDGALVERVPLEDDVFGTAF